MFFTKSLKDRPNDATSATVIVNGTEVRTSYFDNGDSQGSIRTSGSMQSWGRFGVGLVYLGSDGDYITKARIELTKLSAGFE